MSAPTKTCPACDGDGVEYVRRRGRPPLNELRPGRWVWCRRCHARGWVYTRPGRQPVGVVSVTAQHVDRRAERLARGREFYERWRDGETQPAIAETCDPPITRERVRQLIYEAAPAWEVALVHELHAARARLRYYVARGTVPVVRECWICGTETTTATTRDVECPTCERHRDRTETGYVSNALRLVCNINGRWDAHRRSPSVPPVAGIGRNYGQRWVNPGSNTERVIVEAIENGWPLLDHLPPEVLDRVRERIGR